MSYNPEFNSQISSSIISSKELSDSFLEDQESEHLCSIRALWRAVITQALMDAGSNSKKLEYKKIKMKAISWLVGDSEDFAEVCEMAGYSPDEVKKKAKEAIKNGCKWRKEVNPFLKNHNHNNIVKLDEYRD